MMEGSDGARVRIYQLMVRHFGNTANGGVFNGTIADNGCGKFADITDNALSSIRELGTTHLWLTGVLEHASLTSYPDRPADDPLIVKGCAGSPYAIRDYFDVSPDYALEPANRLEEFGALLARCRENGLQVLIDFVPNHVARSYASDVRPEFSFGVNDEPSSPFRWDNNFYYLEPHEDGGGPPLQLPTAEGDMVYETERTTGRVTGNNVQSWTPSVYDWYETVKLNYGHDFTRGQDTSDLPGVDASLEDVPDTWRKMDAVLAYWQDLGVGGFRADMAHMVPMEFWRWAIARARKRDPQCFLLAEAYDGDPAKLYGGNVLEALMQSGFDSVYDGESYELVQQIYEGPKWANDLDELAWRGEQFREVLRYAENHDEVRLANPQRWGGHGMKVGRAVSALLFASAGGPVMIYNGQEVGEPAVGATGFSGDDGRTSIFDYIAVPELAKWVNGHRYDGGGLSPEQRTLRSWYIRLLALCAQPAFANGAFLPLNPTNRDNPFFGRIGDETVSGHWLYAFLRIDPESQQAFLVVVNLHGTESMKGVRVLISHEALSRLGRTDDPLQFRERLATQWEEAAQAESLVSVGLAIQELAPCSAAFLEVTAEPT